MIDRALALARAARQPVIDEAHSRAARLGEQAQARIDAIESLPEVAHARAKWEHWRAEHERLIARALEDGSLRALQEQVAAERVRASVAQGELDARCAAITAYFDEVARRAATERIVRDPPAEVDVADEIKRG